MNWDVVGFGAVAVDDLIYVERLPLPGQKEKVMRRMRQGGGLAGTALVACTRLGVSAAYAGILGLDELSRFTIEEFNREGVDTSLIKIQEKAGPYYSIITVGEKTGERIIYFSPEAVVKSSMGDIPREAVLNSKAIFIDYTVIDVAPEIIKIAQSRAIPIVADIELIEDERIYSVMHSVDHLIINLEMGRMITRRDTPVEIIRDLQRESTGIAIVTDGGNGCWYPLDGDKIIHQPAYKVNVVDTTGCGDVFHGAYAAGLAQNLSITERVKLASAAAALKATKPGGRQGIPSLQTALDFIEEREHGVG